MKNMPKNYHGVLTLSIFLIFFTAVNTPAEFCWISTNKLLAEEGQDGDYFGGTTIWPWGNPPAVAIDSQWILVGAYMDDWGDKEDAGSAYFFKYSGSWQQKPRITAGIDSEAQDWFGHSVSIDGDYAIVGAPDNDAGDAGCAYIFHFESNNWVRKARLTAWNGAGGNLFGYAVSIKGNCAVIGAPDTDMSGSEDAGAAYIFTRSDSNWSQQQKLTANPTIDDGYFGGSVGLSPDGQYCIIGSTNYTTHGQGATYIFHKESGSWTQQAFLQGPVSYDLFGHSVAIGTNFAVVGAPWTPSDPDNYADCGSAYVFQLQDSNWNQFKKLTAFDPCQYKMFGMSVDIDGSYIIVGAPGDPDSTWKGAAYIYVYANAEWNFANKLLAPQEGQDGNWYEQLGSSVAIESKGSCRAVASAPYDDPNTSNAGRGSAYVFDGPSLTITQPTVFEEWVADSNQTILWQMYCQAENVIIDYFNGQAWTQLATAANIGSWIWNALPQSVNSDQCLIRLTDMDPNHPDVNDISDIAFSIKDIVLDTPDGGELLQSGTAYNITWRTRNGLDYVNLYYSRDDGQFWQPIFTAPVSNTGSYSWFVPVVNSANCRVKVSDPSDDNIADTSDTVFTIEIAGDINGDGIVNLIDFSILVGNWLQGG